jgi:hypothetical protein
VAYEGRTLLSDFASIEEEMLGDQSASRYLFPSEIWKFKDPLNRESSHGSARAKITGLR